MTTEHAGWRTSSYSDNGAQCVEVRTAADHTSVRDTKHRASGELAFTADSWSNFVQAEHRA